jgi:hypothetical protein
MRESGILWCQRISVGLEEDPYHEDDEDAIANHLWKSLMEKTRFRNVPVLQIKLPVDQSYRSFHNINELLYIHVSGFLEIWFHSHWHTTPLV